MNDKQKILEQVMPRAVLKALTVEAMEAVPSSQRVGEYVVIRSFPFRVGRESRLRRTDGRIERIERAKMAEREPGNDLYLLDKGKLLNISREHLQLEKTSGGYQLVDRGSACGTRVAGRSVGGEARGGRCELQDGDEIVFGTGSSPYRFTFHSLENL